MKAIQIHIYGGPEVLKYEEVELPVIRGDEVLVKVYASGVNPLDWKIIEGYMTHPLPFIPGWDLSGIIEEAGPEVKDFKKGDAVYGRPDLTRNGSYAEFLAVRASELGHKPSSVDHIAAAAIPLSGLTAWQALFEYGGLKKGQKILINGAAGGVGTFAVQLAKSRGAIVSVAASENDFGFLSDLGADEVIDYNDPGFEDRLASPMDMVLDLIGGDMQKRYSKVLKPGGILVTTQKVEDKDAFEKLGLRIVNMYHQSKREDLEALAKLVDEGSVKPVVYKTFQLEEAAQAHLLIHGGHIRGKIVLSVHKE